MGFAGDFLGTMPLMPGWLFPPGSERADLIELPPSPMEAADIEEPAYLRRSLQMMEEQP